MHFYDRFDRSKLKKGRPIRPFLRIPAAVANKISGPGTIFVGIVEDMAYPENRIVLDDKEEDGVLIKYNIRKELRDRTSRFRELLAERLKGRRLMFLSGDVELNFGHPCGTCVMNDDPAKGVIDRDCRAHGIDNLFIADASFMPTSAATNPSLTVAANALRVAGRIDQRLAGMRDGSCVRLSNEESV
jgi:choline dehydrogenase-like flavoprotein